MNTKEVPELTEIIRASQNALVGVCLMHMSIDSVFYDLERFTGVREAKYLTFKYLCEGTITRKELVALGHVLNDLSEEWHGWPSNEMEIFGQVVYAERLIWKFVDDTRFGSADYNVYTFPKYPIIDATES